VIASWPSPAGDEYAVAFDHGRAARVLVLPALFDEANKLRHFTVETMRRLDEAGIDCFLPDLPGCNESGVALEGQTLRKWRDAAAVAAAHFGATHVLALRGGALTAPAGLPCLHYAPVNGASLLRGLLRARVLASREAGIEETRDGLFARALSGGIELAGYRLGAPMVAELESAAPGVALATIAQSRSQRGTSGSAGRDSDGIGGSGSAYARRGGGWRRGQPAPRQAPPPVPLA
jgi:hypothetical protein